MQRSISTFFFRGAIRAVVLAALLIAARPLSAQPRRFLAGAATIPEATTQLISDTDSVEPGRAFRLGVLFEMAPGWHIYWRYGGDVGFAPEIKWHLPEGFEIGELQWPNPVRIDDDDADLVSYSYKDKVLFFATVTPPEDLEPGAKLEFSTENEWLVCEIQCIPGDSVNDLELTVGSAKASSEAPLFERFGALVPQPLNSGSAPLELDLSGLPSAFKVDAETPQVLTVRARAPWRLLLGEGDERANLFPGGGDDWDVTHPEPAEPEGEQLVAGRKSYDALTFRWALKAYDDAEPGEYFLPGAMRLPLFNSETEQTKTFHVAFDRRVIVGEGGTAPLADAGPTTIDVTEAGAAGDEETSFAFLDPNNRREPERSVLLFLLFAFAGGLLLNIMPCVLPVLSIKVLGFVNQAGEDPKRIFRLGLVFGLGVLISFLVMASVVVAVKSTGAQIGWGFQLQEPRFLVLISAVIFAFGLSLFGVFEIDLPGAATQNLGGLQGREGPGGAFLGGVLATVLATPCTAPLLGPALGFAFSQPAAMIFVFFATIGLGLAAPYVLLSANPRLLKFVPKPGPWMITFKQSMGVLLMATVIWLLWVMGKMAGSDAITRTLSFLIAVGIACWLLGKGFDLSATRRRRWVSSVASFALVVGAYFFFPERYLQAFDGREAEAGETAGRGGEIDWQPFSFARVNELAEQGKTVFVDFTADWCATCKANEKLVLDRAQIAEAFDRYEVEAFIADYTRRDSSITKTLQLFGRAGVPMYVIFPAGRPEEYILLPEILTVRMVKEALAEAAGEQKLQAL